MVHFFILCYGFRGIPLPVHVGFLRTMYEYTCKFSIAAVAFSYRRSEVDGCAATDMDSDLGQGRARGTNVKVIHGWG